VRDKRFKTPSLQDDCHPTVWKKVVEMANEVFSNFQMFAEELFKLVPMLQQNTFFFAPEVTSK